MVDKLIVKAIIFDCFGVLTTDTWGAFVASLPDDVDVDAARAVHRAYDAGLITKQESSEQIQKITGRHFTELEDALSGEMAKNTALLDYIRELRDRSFKIGLLSNIATNWIRDSFLTAEEQALFDDMVMSYEVGTVKPDPRIFQLACDRLGIAPSQAVMIDDIDRYTEAAKAEGMQAVVYRDFRQMKAELEEILTRSA